MFQADRAADDNRTVLRLSTCNYFDADFQFVLSPSVAKPVPLSEDMDLRGQEALISFDLLHALLGYEGSYFRFSERYNPRLLHSRILGPDHKVAKHLDVTLKTISKKLLRYGKYYSGLKAFAQIYNHPLFGKVNHRLCREIRVLLELYRRLIAHFEHLFKSDPTFSLRTMDNDITQHFADKLKHMYEIACLVHAVTEDRNPSFISAFSVPENAAANLAGRGAKFDSFLESVRSDIKLNGSVEISSDVEPFPLCKGGLTLRVVQNRLNQYKGDHVSSQFLSGIFEAISKDYLAILNQWLSLGEFEDVFSEFFIKRNDPPMSFFHSNMEKYWQELFVVKTDGIPSQFEAKDLQTKILLTGKYLNIFKQCTDNASINLIAEAVTEIPAPLPIESLFASDLILKIHQCYDRANRLLLKLLFKGYYLNSFLESMHQTFFLANSFKVDNYLGTKLPELSRNKTSTSAVAPTIAFNEMVMLKDLARRYFNNHDEDTTAVIDIPKILATVSVFSIDSKSFYEIAEEILNIKSFSAEDLALSNENASAAIRKLVTRSLQKRPELADTEELSPAESFEEAVIAGVNVDVNLPFPLSYVLSENFKFEYQMMFKFQMILKFTAKFMDNVWTSTSTSTVWRNKNHEKPVLKLMLRSQVLLSRMKNLINTIENYVSYDIINSNYQKLRHQTKLCQEWAQDTRPTSSGFVASSSNYLSEDTQFLMSHGSANNDVFEEKIFQNSKRHNLGSKLESESSMNDLLALSDQIGIYLSNTLRDSMITDGVLLQCVRKMLNEIVDFTSTVSRLKKSLIMVNASLLQEYSQKFPEKFQEIEFDSAVLKQRVSRLNDLLTWNWNRFNETLERFTQELKDSGRENPAMLILAEKLTLI